MSIYTKLDRMGTYCEILTFKGTWSSKESTNVKSHGIL